MVNYSRFPKNKFEGTRFTRVLRKTITWVDEGNREATLNDEVASLLIEEYRKYCPRVGKPPIPEEALKLGISLKEEVTSPEVLLEDTEGKPQGYKNWGERGYGGGQGPGKEAPGGPIQASHTGTGTKRVVPLWGAIKANREAQERELGESSQGITHRRKTTRKVRRY